MSAIGTKRNWLGHTAFPELRADQPYHRDPNLSLLPPSRRDQDDAPALEQERVRREAIDDAVDRRARSCSASQNHPTSEKTNLGLCQGRNQSANVGDETS